MAPLRTSGNSRSSSLKQGTLKFGSAKRTASTSTAGKPKKATKSLVVATPPSGSSPSSPGSERSGASTPVIEVSSGSVEPSNPYKRQKEEEASVGLRPAKRRHVSPAPEVASPPLHEAVDGAVEVKELKPSLNPGDRRWSKLHKAARKRMDNARPVHAGNQNRVHEILRIFDLSYEYGPCIGVSRLERWERAYAMGLNPPQEIREILNTLEGAEKPEYSQSVFHDMV